MDDECRLFFNKAKNALKWCVGLNLSLIEQVRLKHITKEVLNENRERLTDWHTDIEIVVRFLSEEYGIIGKSDFKICCDPLITIYYSQEASDILNWLQQQMHKP